MCNKQEIKLTVISMSVSVCDLCVRTQWTHTHIGLLCGLSCKKDEMLIDFWLQPENGLLFCRSCRWQKSQVSCSLPTCIIALILYPTSVILHLVSLFLHTHQVSFLWSHFIHSSDRRTSTALCLWKMSHFAGVPSLVRHTFSWDTTAGSAVQTREGRWVESGVRL